MSSNQRAGEAEAGMDKYADEVNLTIQQCNRRYLNKGQAAAYILTRKPELRTRHDLKELQDMLDVEAVSVFSNEGVNIRASTICRK